MTPGNASGLNDGAAAVVICSGRFLKTKNLSPIAKIIGFAQAGVEPMDMGLAPVEAVTKLVSNYFSFIHILRRYFVEFTHYKIFLISKTDATIHLYLFIIISCFGCCNIIRDTK